MKHQALFTSKDKVKRKTSVSSAAILLGSLSNIKMLEQMLLS